MAGTLPIYFFVDNQLIAEGRHPDLVYLQGSWCKPYSKAFFCPVCGEVWARVVIHEGGRWSAFTHECPRCPSYSPIYSPQGSLMLEWDKEYMASWPPEVWKYEACNAARLDN